MIGSDITVYLNRVKAADWCDGDPTCSTHVGNCMVAALMKEQTFGAGDVGVRFEKARIKRWLCGDAREFPYVEATIKRALGI